jgi:hypothetical protein
VILCYGLLRTKSPETFPPEARSAAGVVQALMEGCSA